MNSFIKDVEIAGVKISNRPKRHLGFGIPSLDPGVMHNLIKDWKTAHSLKIVEPKEDF